MIPTNLLEDLRHQACNLHRSAFDPEALEAWMAKVEEALQALQAARQPPPPATTCCQHVWERVQEHTGWHWQCQLCGKHQPPLFVEASPP